MKKTFNFNTKIFFAFTMMFALIGMVCAVTYKIDKKGTLSNVVNGSSVSRNKVEDTKTFGVGVVAKMIGVDNVTGSNAEGGIRVKTIAKRTTLGIVTNTQEIIVPVYRTTTNSSSALFKYTTETNKVKVTWENWTGNTSFYARFVAYDNV